MTVFVTWRTTAEEFQGSLADVPKFVLFAGRNSDGITGLDLCQFPFDPDAPLADEDEINLFCPGVIMLLGAGTRRQPGLGEALVANRRVAFGQQFADLRSVLGN